MPDTSATSRPDLEAIEARVKAATGEMADAMPRSGPGLPLLIPMMVGKVFRDIPALIKYIKALEAVVKAARELRKPLYNFFGFGFDIYLHDNKTWSGDCTPEQARAEYEKCDAAQSKLKKALAALGDGDG